MATVNSSRSTRVHGNLGSYQRIMMDNPKNSLRNRMSELNISTVPPRKKGPDGNPLPTKRTRPPQEGAGGAKADKQGGGGGGGQFEGTDDGWMEDGGALHTEGTGDGNAGGEYGGAVPGGGITVYETEQEAAGHSELQAAFDRAYERMLTEAPPSIVDTVLSEAWQPNAKKSAVWRRAFQKNVHKKTDWQTRQPADEKRPFYDSLSDNNCRRVVENPAFRKMLMRTRPDSEFLFAQRVMSEESRKPDAGKERKLRMGKRRQPKSERWDECVRRFMEEESGLPPPGQHGKRQEEESEAKGEGGEGGEGGAEGGGGGNEQIKEAWGVADGGENVGFNSLNSVLMSDPQRPQAFEGLKKQLETIWRTLRVPPADTKHVRRYIFRDPTPTNLAHLFYQVSRWTQYHAQVQKTSELIYRREMLLADLKDHLQVAGGVVDEALTHKLSDFYAYSHEAIYHCNAVKALYPGSAEASILLQDYIHKVRVDTVQVKAASPQHRPPTQGEEGEGGMGEGALQVYKEVQEHRVKLAAELVLESVQREAAVYAKMLSKQPPFQT